MKLAELEHGLRALLLAQDEVLIEGADPARQRVYRRLVRGNLMSAMRRGVPILRKLAGHDVVDALIARYLHEVAPRTRLVRFLPIEFASWLLSLPPAQLPHPAAGELAHWEALEIEVVMAPDVELTAQLSRAPLDACSIHMHPSTRLCAYRHPVHVLTSSSIQWPAQSAEPALLLAWRAAERFTAHALDGATAKVLVETASGAAIGEAFARIEASLGAGDVLDRALVRASLVDLQRRGAIVGFQ